MKQRPTFLSQNHQDGNSIVEAFKKLSVTEAVKVDAWLVWAIAYGSMTWQEEILYNWINENDYN